MCPPFTCRNWPTDRGSFTTCKKRGDSLSVRYTDCGNPGHRGSRLGKRVQDIVVMMLDRPRHKEIVAQIRKAGASLRMIGDGDIAAAMAPSLPDTDVDLYMGIGGSPEAILAAAGIKCLGGDMHCKMWPRDRDERESLSEAGSEKDLERVFSADDLATERTLFFARPALATAHFCAG